MQNPPVILAKIAIGDGSIGSVVEFEFMPVMTIIETYPQLIAYDTDVYETFRDQYVHTPETRCLLRLTLS